MSLSFRPVSIRATTCPQMTSLVQLHQECNSAVDPFINDFKQLNPRANCCIHAACFFILCKSVIKVCRLFTNLFFIYPINCFSLLVSRWKCKLNYIIHDKRLLKALSQMLCTFSDTKVWALGEKNDNIVF